MQPYEFLASFGARRFPKGERKALWGVCGRIPLPRRGLTRRLRRGSRACSPMGRSHFSFGGERKVCKRKPAARRLREKGFYCPFCRRGSLCRAQHDWPDFTCDPARSELAFFRRQNRRAFFPPLPIAALAPVLGAGHTYTLRLGMLRCGLDIFATQKASVVSNPRWPFEASHEARRRMAVTQVKPHVPLTPCALTARSPGCRGSSPAASREACCRAAVTLQPSHTFSYAPARLWRAVHKGI